MFGKEKFAQRPKGEEYGLYVMYDAVAEECGPVYSAKNDGTAMRAYRQLLQQVDRVDVDAYKLYRIARYNTFTMAVSVEADPVHIVNPPSQLDLINEATIVKKEELN